MPYQYHHHITLSPLPTAKFNRFSFHMILFTDKQTNRWSDWQLHNLLGEGNNMWPKYKWPTYHNFYSQFSINIDKAMPVLCLYISESTPTISTVIVTSDNAVNLAEILHWSSCNDTQHCHPTDSHLTHYAIQTTQLVAKKCCRWLCLLSEQHTDI